MTGSRNALARSLTLLETKSGLASLTSRAVRMSLACCGAAAAMNHGSTAMQCPPTPGPGRRMLTRGCRLASLINSQTLTRRRSQRTDNSLAKAILTSRYAFSASFANSAVRAAAGHAADQAGIVDDLVEDAAGQNALGAVCDLDHRHLPVLVRKGQVGPTFRQQGGEAIGRTDRRGRFQHDQISRLQDAGDRAGRGLDI